MQANPLLAAFLVVLALTVVTVGPRDVVWTPGPYLAGGVALALVAPYLVWQVAHGLPHLEVARGIAGGASGSSSTRLEFVPSLLLLSGPPLVPVWVVGVCRVWRAPRLCAVALAFVVLAVLFLVVGAKPYYVAGLFPLFLAAGAQPVLDRIRWRGAGALLALSLPAIFVGLPVLPVAHADAVVKLNYDAGETVGWPDLVRQVAIAHRSLPNGTAILASNYGEAGAIDQFGPALGLPAAYSGHMAYTAWGPPPVGTTTVLAVGFEPDRLRTLFASVEPAGTVRNRWGIDNEENGAALFACTGLKVSWSTAWRMLRSTR